MSKEVSMTLGIILIIAGIVCILFSKVNTFHSSTGKAMGALFLKYLARFAGGIAILIGIMKILGYL